MQCRCHGIPTKQSEFELGLLNRFRLCLVRRSALYFLALQGSSYFLRTVQISAAQLEDTNLPGRSVSMKGYSRHVKHH